MRLPLPVALLVTTGCAASGSSAADLSPPPPSLAFVDGAGLAAIAEGSDAQIIHGPQGGYHIAVSLLARGIWPGTVGVPGAPDDPTTALHAFRPDGVEITLTTDGTAVLHQAYQPAGDAVLLADRQLRLDTRSPAAFAGQLFRIAAEVVDRDARTASASLHVVVLAPVN